MYHPFFARTSDLKAIWSLAKHEEKNLLAVISHQKTLQDEKLKRSRKVVRFFYQASGSIDI